MIVVLPDPLDNDGNPIPPCGSKGASAGGGGLEISLEQLLASGIDPTRFPPPKLLMDNVADITIEETLGDILVCTSSSITTNTTTNILLGDLAAAGEGITDACDFPLGRSLNFIFTTSGAGADFDVTADLHWVVH